MNDLPAAFSGGKSKLPFIWTENLSLALLNRIPTRYRVGRRRSRSKSKHLHPGVEDITTLKTSFNLWDGIRELQHHKFRTTDLQYVFVAAIALFSLSISPSAPGIKFMAVMASLWVLLMPATRQFFLPSAVIWVWLLYFFSSR